jgi:hypothetical protein
MSDEIFLHGKQYVSSRRASENSGYARDYIGQLARGGLIDAQRVGGLWYVNIDSLNAYKKNADTYVPMPPVGAPAPESAETIVSFDGMEYVSAAKAAKLTSYNQDYIGQLARSGKILSRQVGNRWYIDKRGLQEHKAQKDRMLASVRSEAVGLHIPGNERASKPDEALQSSYMPVLTYTHEEHDLLPALRTRTAEQEDAQTEEGIVSKPDIARSIPIRVVRPRKRVSLSSAYSKQGKTLPVRSSRMTMSRAINAGVALTFVIVLSYGFVSLRQGSLYTFAVPMNSSVLKSQALSASALTAFERIGTIIESFLAPQVHYERQ